MRTKTAVAAFFPSCFFLLLALGGQGRAREAGPEKGDGPRAAPALFSDLGHHHRAISTRSVAAQRYFDQGLRLVYGFNHDEAQRDFEEAARLDPDCAICWWGAALTLGPNINLPALPDRARAAWDFEQKALAKVSKASAVEQDLIRALARRYANPAHADAPAQKALDTAYAEAMRAVARRHPQDDDVQTLFAESMMDLRPWDLWGPDGAPYPGTLEIVATLERVLARNPRHPGANHYYVHAVEASPHPEKALAAAGRLEKAMPGAGHIVHMPSHVYARVGRYGEASEANRRAITVDRKYVAAAKPEGFYAMYLAHNYQFLWSTTMMEGRSAESIRAARDTVAAVPPAMLKEMPGIDVTLSYPQSALLRFGKWEEALAEPAPPEDFPFAGALWHYARGVALAKLGRTAEAEAEKERVDAILGKIPADAVEGQNQSSALLTVASRTLSGQILARSGKSDEAIRSFRQAVAAQDGLHYDEPPDWYYPVRHSLGAILLSLRRGAEAEAVFREDLKRNPDNGWSLKGLAASLALEGKKEEAARAEKQFRQAWTSADVAITSSEF